MKQSKSKKNFEDTAIAYVRLSRDDQQEGDSYSIQNQKKLLTKAAKEHGYSNIITFCDDGVSGVTMDRPGLNEMLKLIEAGRASAVYVKDMSRLGRNYIEVGRLTEDFFPEHNIRLVAVSDGIDTNEGESELAPIRNLFNEWYARDISKKRRISNKIKGASGEPLSLPPFGYTKDPDNAKRWIVDEESAAVVRRIFSMSLNGFGTDQIASALTKDFILTPLYYWRSKGINRQGKITGREPHRWNASTVIKILGTQEYCGDVINFKTYSKSYKNKKRIVNDDENRAIFKGVHESVIDLATWEKVQQRRGTTRKRRNADGEKNMFSGLLVCGDCGHNLWYHFNQGNRDIRFFNCSNYKANRGGTCPTTHYVRVDFLEQVVLGEVRRLTRFASQYENEFVQAIIGHSRDAVLAQRQLKQKELQTLQARDREIDTIIARLYEDNGSGKISDDRFAKLSKQFEEEQCELSPRMKSLRAELDQVRDDSMTTEMFQATVRKYTRAKKLTERMLTELIERIEVFHAEKVDGVHVQRLRIHYSFVGAIEIPDSLPLPEPEVVVNTRKGVAVSYAAQKAM